MHHNNSKRFPRKQRHRKRGSSPHFSRGRKRERSPPYYSAKREPSPHYRQQSRSPSYFQKNTDSSPRRIKRSKSPAYHYHESSLNYSEMRESLPTYLPNRSRSKSREKDSRFNYHSPYLDRNNSPPRFLESNHHFSNEEHNCNNDKQRDDTSWTNPYGFSTYSPGVTSQTPISDTNSAHDVQNFWNPVRHDVAPDYVQNIAVNSAPEMVNSLEELDNMPDAEILNFPLSAGSHHKLRLLLDQGRPHIQAKRSIIKNLFLKSEIVKVQKSTDQVMRNESLEQINNMSFIDIQTFPLSKDARIELGLLKSKGIPYIEAKHMLIKDLIKSDKKKSKVSDKINSIGEADKLTDMEIQAYRLTAASKKRLQLSWSKGVPYIEAKRMIIKENFINHVTRIRRAEHVAEVQQPGNKKFTNTKPDTFTDQPLQIPSYEKPRMISGSENPYNNPISSFSWSDIQHSTSMPSGGFQYPSLLIQGYGNQPMVAGGFPVNSPSSTGGTPSAESGSYIPKTSFKKQVGHLVDLGMSYAEAKRNIRLLQSNSLVEAKDQPEKQAAATTESVKLKVIHSNHPKETLTIEHLDAIQESITDQIISMGLKRPDIQPSFLSVKHKPGWLSVECADSATAVWLRSIASELQPAEGVAIDILEDSHDPHKVILVGTLPDSVDYTDEKIVALLQVQNEVKLSLLERTDMGVDTKVVLEMEAQSMRKLKNRDYKLTYKFGRVKLMPLEG